MKILLLGEYSGLHNNLKGGLQELGHDVTLAASGDGFKKFPADIIFDSDKKGFVGKVERHLKYFLNLKKMTGYDMVQLINPIVFNPKLGINNFLLDFIIKNNDKVSLLGAGCDAFFWQKTRYKLKYGPFDDNLKYDYSSDKNPYYDSSKSLEWNTKLAKKVDHIIPIMYEYQIGYEGYENLRACIPIPMNTKKIKYQENFIKDKLVVFHGLNRYGFKGTRIVEDAFSELQKKYPNDLELLIKGNMPIDKYLDVMNRTNVVIDQVYSHSCGMNAIYALAMGKVVLGGAEPESLHALNIDSTPVINIKPDKFSIIKQIEFLLKNKERIHEMGMDSRSFVETYHCDVDVADNYLKTWSLSK
ncbi:hypothetical protein [Pectobacterium colocasium]|uniref:hypothetical protein n=1 Tax=Pectobacterium colocasium TaxID=2878098 RepID=UPI003B28DCDA